MKDVVLADRHQKQNGHGGGRLSRNDKNPLILYYLQRRRKENEVSRTHSLQKKQVLIYSELYL